MAFGTFQSVTPEDQCIRKPKHLSDTDLVNPAEADCLEQGEWVVPSAAVDREYERYGNTRDAGPVVAYPAAAPRGSTDQQALGRVEVYVKWEEAVITSYDPAPPAPYAVGSPLKVSEETIDGIDRSVLTLADGNQENVQAVVVMPPDVPADFTPMRIQRAWYVTNV